MNTKSRLTVFTATLAGVMALLAVGCNKPADTTVAAVSPPPTTVGTVIDDSVVTTRVRTALMDNMEVKSFDLKRVSTSWWSLATTKFT